MPQALQNDSNMSTRLARREAATLRAEAPHMGLQTEPPPRTQARTDVAQPPSRTSSPTNSISSNLPQKNSGSGLIRSSSPTSQPQVQQQAILSGLTSSLRPRVDRRPSNATQPQILPLNGLPASLIPARVPLATSPLRIPKENLPSPASRPSADFVHTSSPLSVMATTSELPRSESPVSVQSHNLIPIPEAPPPRREHNNRVSFFDPVNQAALDRLVSGDYAEDGNPGDEETSQATMASIEEMLEGFEWASDDFFGRRRKNSKGAADLVGARLLDELIALEKVIHEIVPLIH